MGVFENLYQFFRRFGFISKNIIGLPLVGEIKGRFLVDPPRLATSEFGPTNYHPAVLEILVDHDTPGPLDVGNVVKDLYFPDAPPFVFNVCFCCARPTLFSGGDYANPLSHWFNVFFGFYEIDARKDLWNRPFGFRNAQSHELHFEDLMRIGKADWNHFSNYVYGVPADRCAAHAPPDSDIRLTVRNSAVRIGGNTYVEAEAEEIRVVSGYVSGQDGEHLRCNDPFFSAIWRTVFGRPRKHPDYPDSFISTRMKMRFYIRWFEEYDTDLNATAYKTVIYGGCINMDYVGPVNNESFLDAQMDAVRRSATKLAFRKHSSPTQKASWKR